MVFIKVNMKKVDKLEKNLNKFGRVGVFKAMRDTVNDVAIETKRRAKKRVQNKMVLRNKWTLGGIKTIKAKTTKRINIKARTGSFADYMRLQELGGTSRARMGKNKPIPTSFSAGLGRKTQPRTKVTKDRLKVGKITLRNKRFKGNRKAQSVQAVRAAVKGGSKARIIYLNMPGIKKGIYRVKGGRKTELKKNGWPKGAHLVMIHSLQQSSVRIPRNPWLEPSIPSRSFAQTRYVANLKRLIDKQFKF